MIPLPPRPEPATDSEAAVQTAIRKHVGALPDVRLWRNNVGQIKKGKQAITFGLFPGSADLVGIVAPRGIWLVIEVKRPGWRPAKSGPVFDHEEEQRQWIAVVRQFGGVGGFADSVERAMLLVEEARERARTLNVT